jgi:hypothetical protein
MEIKVKKVRRNIPEEELIADLRRAAESTASGKLSIREYDRAGGFNSKTIISRYGTSNNAIAKVVKLLSSN